MPIDYSKYPPNWKDIRSRILKRANNKCELCGVENYKYVIRSKIGMVLGEVENKKVAESYAQQLGIYKKPTKIILTIHHIDGDINNNKDCNLIALCQRCHLRLDRCKHIKRRI